MSYLSDKQREENRQRFITKCENAVSYWSDKGNLKNVQYFKDLKNNR